jgi:hypothetical protein
MFDVRLLVEVQILLLWLVIVCCILGLLKKKMKCLMLMQKKAIKGDLICDNIILSVYIFCHLFMLITGIVVSLVGGAHLTGLIQNFYYLAIPNGSWAHVGTTIFPILDVTIPLYLVATETIFIIKFFNSIIGDKDIKKTYKMVLFANTIVIDFNDRLYLFWLLLE